MPSFIIIRVPAKKQNSRTIEEQVRRLSVFESEGKYKQGTLPDTFRATHGCMYFEVGTEYEGDIRKLDGVVSEKQFKSFQIAFVGDSFIALEKGSSEDLDWIKHYLEGNFVQEVVLDPIQFDEKVLRKVTDSNPDVFQIEHEPSSRGNETVDRLTLTGRGVTKSKLYEEHGDEPLRKVKVKLNQSVERITVSFYKDGKLTIHGSDPDSVLAVLSLIVDKIISPFATRTTFQRRLF